MTAIEVVQGALACGEEADGVRAGLGVVREAGEALGGLDLQALGIPTLRQVAARYSERAGVPVRALAIAAATGTVRSREELIALEPEEESPILFLRLRKAARAGTLAVYSIAPLASSARTMFLIVDAFWPMAT